MTINSLLIIIPANNEASIIIHFFDKVRAVALLYILIREFTFFVAFLFWIFLIKIFRGPHQNIFEFFLHDTKKSIESVKIIFEKRTSNAI